MKKKSGMDARLIGVGIVLVALAAFLLAGGVDYLAFTGGQGLRVTGITADRTISNDADIANAKFIVSTIFDGSGGAIWGTTEGQPFKDQSGDVIPTQYDIKITAESVNEYASYIIQNEGASIKKYTRTDWDFYPYSEPAGTVYTFDSPYFRKYYIIEQSVGNKGYFESKNVDFEGTISVDAHNEKLSSTITNYHTGATFRTSSGVYVGDAAWGGSLVTGTGIPAESGFAVVLPSGANRWRVTKDYEWRYYADAKTQFNSVVSTWIARFLTPSFAQVDVELNKVNTAADTLLALDRQILTSGQTQVRVDTNGDGVPDADAIKVNLRENNIIWSWQYVTFYIKASWVGAYVPVTMPVIISTDCEDVSSGEASILHVEIMNTGGAGGTIRGEIVQPCKVQQIAQGEVYIPAGETRVMDIRTSQGSYNLKEIVTCTARVYDANKAENQDTATITCQLLKAKECVNIGEYKGDTRTNCISICNNDGLWQEVHCCGNDESLSFDASKTQWGGWYCKAGNGNGNGDDNCYVECVADNDCGLGITIPGMLCRVKCQITCWFYDKILYFIGGTVLLVLFLIWKVFSKVSPHARVAKGIRRRYKPRVGGSNLYRIRKA